jgi:16S rRNA (uracil1498-N3)-methyltransferase
MKLPLFYKPDILPVDSPVVLDEPASKHIIQVLRMQEGEQLRLTDGRGTLFNVAITNDNRKRCEVKIISYTKADAPVRKISIAISPVKNNSRFEWFLEKATEIGVNEIIPLICERTEKQQFKYERMKNILVSAMLQSQQFWLPLLMEPLKFTEYVAAKNNDAATQKFIAHCEDENNKQPLTSQLNSPESGRLILIGPEGDFTPAEIAFAIGNNFTPVALGETRLRTETAGIVAATLLCNS